MKSVLMFGRQPSLGLAEVESLYGSDNVTPIGKNCAVVDIDPCNLYFDRLGGSIKLGKLLSEFDGSEWKKIEKFLVESSPKHSLDMPEGKMTLGISAYNFSVSSKEVMGLSLKIKKAIQATGRSVRVVPNKEPELNSASVTHNKLTSEKGWELLLIRSGEKTYIAQTVLVQDIKAYSGRDQARPYRDARVGMLPPKLAQIIINLAAPKVEVDSGQELCEPMKLDYKQTVLDPFCGSGAILQEALLMGFNTIGSDMDSRMLDYSRKNIEWLKKKYRISSKAKTEFLVEDALKNKWQHFDFVASEANLGKPLTSLPSSEEMKNIVSSANKLITTFLTNLHGQTKSGSKHCIAIPAWQTSNGYFKQLPLIDRLEEIGYNLVDFKHVSAEQLVYYRPDQIVARKLLVITRK